MFVITVWGVHVVPCVKTSDTLGTLVCALVKGRVYSRGNFVYFSEI